MKRPTIKIIAFCIVFMAASISLPILLNLKEIFDTSKEFRFDMAVFGHKANSSRKLVSAEEFLNPPYLSSYDLNIDRYIDSEGYFSPNGKHWENWSLRTKTAFLLMIRDDELSSAWKIHVAIRDINNYYKRGNKTTSLVYIVDAAIKE